MEQHFQSFQKEDNLARCTEVFSRKFFFFIQLCSRNWFLEFVDKWFRENFCTMCRCFQVFESCGWMESAHKLPWEVPLFQVFFFSLQDHAANRNNSRGRAQDNYCLQTSFSNIKLSPKNVNHAQVFEVTGTPLTRARSPDKLSCKSENGVGDKGDTFKARRIRAKIPYTLRFRALQPPTFWKEIKKLGSEPSTFYISLLSPLSFHVSGVFPFLLLWSLAVHIYVMGNRYHVDVGVDNSTPYFSSHYLRLI